MGAIVLVAITVAVITLNSLDLSQYQAPIVAQVQAATGRELKIDGELRLHIGLRPAVSVQGLSFQNAGWSQTPEMVTLERFAVRLSLLPLLLGRVEVGRIELRGARILLETNARGEGNWIFTPSEAPASAKPRPESEREPAPSQPAAEEPGSDLVALVKHAVIEDASLLYRDAASGQTQSVEIERLVARAESETAPVRIELAGRYNREPFRLDATLEGVTGLLAGGRLGIELEARAGGAKLGARGGIEKPLEATGIDLGIDAGGESLAGLSGLAGSPLPDLGPYRLSAKIGGGGSEYRIRELVAAMGGSEIRGSVSADLAGPRPRIEVALRSPLLDLADFQGEPVEDRSTEAASSGAGRASEPASGGEAEPAAADRGDGGRRRLFPDDPLPLEGLKAADARVALEIDELRSGELRLEKLGVGVELEGGRLRIDPLATSLVGGTLAGQLTLDSSGSVPALETSLKVEGLEAGALLAALESTDLLSGGELSLDLDLAGEGISVRRLMASLSGRVALTMAQSTIQSRWAKLSLSDLGSLLGGGESGERTAINCLVSDFAVSQGVARAESLVIDASGVALFGSGSVDLGSEKLRLRLDPMPKDRDLAVATPPIRIGGRLAEPSFGIDPGATAEKVLDVVTGLALGEGAKPGESVRTRPGLDGCHQLLEAREQESSRQADSRKAATKRLKKAGKKKLKKRANQVLEDATKDLDRLFGR
jgi:uncharacterized protein involved in outer membrane biogenesis